MSLNLASEVYDIYEADGLYIAERARIHFMLGQALNKTGDLITAQYHHVLGVSLRKAIVPDDPVHNVKIEDFDNLIICWAR